MGNQVTQGTKDSIGTIGQSVSWSGIPSEEVHSYLAKSIESSKTLSESSKRNLNALLGSTLNGLSQMDMMSQAQAFAIVQGVLASSRISGELNAWLQSIMESSTTTYDIVLTATPRTTDTFVASSAAFIQDLDYWDYVEEGAFLDSSASYQDTLISVRETQYDWGIAVSWSKDLISYDFAELLAGSIGILAVALNWNSDDVDKFSQIVGSMGLAALASASPLMLIVTVVSLARAFHLARKSGDWKEFSDGLAKGGICTGAVLLTTSLMSGPMVVVLLSGICAGILAHQATKNVSFVEIGQFVIQRIGKDAKPEIA